MHTLADQRALPSLYRLITVARRTEDPRSALAGVLDELIAVFAANAGAIALFNPGSGRLEVEVQVGMPTGAEDAGLKPGHGVTGWCVLNSKSLLVSDVAHETRYIAVRPATRCEMAAPMTDGDTVIGVIDLDSDRPGGFTAADLALLERLTLEATAIVLQLWRTRHLRAKARQLETLLTAGQSLVAKLETHELFAALTRDTRDMMQARVCALYLHDAAHRTVRCVALDAPDLRALALPDATLSVEGCLVSAPIQTKKQVEFADIRSPIYRSLADLPADPTLQATLFTPIIFEGEVLGVLAVFIDHPHRFDDDEKRACATLASLGAVALQNARLYARVFQSEETLRKNEQLTTLGLLAAEIAHEIRNPLTVLKLLHGGLDLDFPANDPRRTDLRVINEKLDQLEAIVLRVLNFAKAPTALHSRWSVTEIIEDTLVLVRPKLAQAKIHVTFQRPAHTLVVDAHKGQLQQVLLNLIFNSTEAMTGGGALTIVLAEQLRGTTPFATIDVADNGSGIPAELAPRVFDSFLTGRPGGTGLGLAIAKRILEGHHGEITLVSTSAAGTVMRISLPLAKK
jgi:signal transduction histidine kinase